MSSTMGEEVARPEREGLRVFSGLSLDMCAPLMMARGSSDESLECQAQMTSSRAPPKPATIISR